jgi:hypothetical protein
MNIRLFVCGAAVGGLAAFGIAIARGVPVNMAILITVVVVAIEMLAGLVIARAT